MKRLIRITSAILALAMLIAFPVYAETSQRASNYFVRTLTYMENTSGTTLEVWFDVTAVGLMDELGASTIKIQRSTDKSTWATVKTFSKSSYSQMTDEDTARHCDYVSYTGTAGYYYRAKVTFYAKNDTGTGEYVMYTSTISVP